MMKWFAARRDARREALRQQWQTWLVERVVDRSQPEAIRTALAQFIVTNHVTRSDAEWLVHG